jgi:hypothetical protein
MLCSSTMLLANKLAVHATEAPSLVLFAQVSWRPTVHSPQLWQLLQPTKSAAGLAGQMASCALLVGASGAAGAIEVDPLRPGKAAGYAIAAGGFLLALYANIKMLQVEVVRAAVPGCFPRCAALFQAARTAPPASTGG